MKITKYIIIILSIILLFCSGVMYSNLKQYVELESKCGDLEIHYPALKIRILNIDGTETYCDIAEGTINATGDSHLVYFLNSTCVCKPEAFETSINLTPTQPHKIIKTEKGDCSIICRGINCSEKCIPGGLDLYEYRDSYVSEDAEEYRYLIEKNENELSCAEKTFQKFNITNEDIEAKQLVFLLSVVTSREPLTYEMLTSVTNKTLDAFDYNFECIINKTN